MFYDLYSKLCREKGVSPSRAALDMGISKSLPTSWKNTGTMPKGEILSKIAVYFGVSTDYLLGNEKSAQAAGGEDAELSEEDKRLQALNEKIALLSEEKRAALMDIINFLLEK